MGSRISLLVAASVVSVWSLPGIAAEYVQTGDWVFHSKAFAEDGDTIWYSCVASTESVEGTELSLRLEPTADDGFAAGMALANDAWALDEAPVRVRLDVGADHWMLPGQGNAGGIELSWGADPYLLVFLEDLASASFAGLIARDGTTVSQFSLRGSRSAIEAMKACAEEQVERGLAEVLNGAAAGDGANPF